MQANCPPESGGQRHRVLCDDARGGSTNELFQNAFSNVQLWNHPQHDLDCCLDRAALLTQEGSSADMDTLQRSFREERLHKVIRRELNQIVDFFTDADE